MTLIYWRISGSNDGVTVNQREQYQNPDTETAEQNSTIISFIVNACDFPPVPFLNVLWEYKELNHSLTVL